MPLQNTSSRLPRPPNHAAPAQNRAAPLSVAACCTLRRRSCWPAAQEFAADPAALCFQCLSPPTPPPPQALGAGVTQGCHHQQHLKMSSPPLLYCLLMLELCSPLALFLLSFALALASFSPLLSVMCMCKCGSTTI